MGFRKLSRRQLLKGSGGIAIALPWLEIMGAEKAAAQTVSPNRFLYFFQGQSLGADAQNQNFFLPPTTGPNFQLSVSLSPLGKYNVKNDVTVVSGLRIPVSGPGSRDPGSGTIHANGHFAQFLGTPANYSSAGGIGADQLVVPVLSQGTRFSSLEFLGQPYTYHGTPLDGVRNIASYTRNSAGSIVPVYPEVSPRKAFDSLFGSVAGGDPAVIRRRSILDYVLGQRDNLMKNLGGFDRARLTEHFDQIRDLERSLASLSSCAAPPDPGTDPALNLSTSSGETRRNRVFMDIIHMALVCDLTRVVNHMFTQIHCFLSTAEVGGALAGVNTDLHELGHFGGTDLPAVPAGTPVVTMGTGAPKLSGATYSYCMALGHAWAIENFAYLVSRLKATPEGGGTLLDHCAMVMGFEGGHGGQMDQPVTAADSFSSHSTQNMAMIVAGGAGGLRHGRHLAMPNVHPARVTISAMKAAGGPTTLGQISGELPALFTS